MQADGTPSRLGFVPWIGNWYHIGWIWTFGGDYFDPVAFRPTLDRKENVNALEWEAEYAMLYGTKAALTGLGFNDDSLGNEKVSMMATHDGVFSGILKNNPDMMLDGGAMPHPEGGSNGAWSGGFAWSVPVGAKNTKAAARFIEFFSRTENQIVYGTLCSRIPANTRALREIASRMDIAARRNILLQSDAVRFRHPQTSIMFNCTVQRALLVA